MQELHLGANIFSLRKREKITQEELAVHMGVSKSSVSKWETGVSYPDICVLPRLAALFHVSVDQLMGYESQLTKEEIRSIYYDLAKKMEENPQEAFQECKELIRDYYSCFPFLYEMALLLSNHMVLFQEKEEIMKQIESLCERVERESQDADLVQNSVMLKSILYMTKAEFSCALSVLGEEVQPFSQKGELIAACYQNMGNTDKAKEAYQVCIYQHLLFFIQDSVNYMMGNMQDTGLCDVTMHRIRELLSLYHIEEIHGYTATQFYFSAAVIYAARGDLEKAEKQLEKLADVAQKSQMLKSLFLEDTYFDRINGWLEKQELGASPPRRESMIRQLMVETIEEYPAFAVLKGRPGFQRTLEHLRRL